MKRVAMVMMVFVLSILAVGQPAQAVQRPIEYALPGDQVFPEGIAFQRGTSYFYVSSTTDGTIFRGSTREDTAEIFLPGGADGRTTAVGLKVDDRGRLFVAGGATGMIFIYNTATGGLIRSFNIGKSPTFLNDVAIGADGAAYVTDSVNPLIYKVAQNGAGGWTLETFIDFTGTALVYQAGFNVNGIAAVNNGQYLVVVQSNTGKLFRIDIATKVVSEINLGGETVANGDGILLKGRTLYVARNRQELIVKIALSNDLSSGTVISSTTDERFKYPTTIAIGAGRMLVVNSQFDKRAPGTTPELPFSVSSVPVP